MTCQIIGEDGVNWWLVTALFVAFPIAKWLLTVIYEIGKQLVPAPDILKRYCRTDAQSWAVVTGATDGIGLGFCQVLTKLGFNLVLVSRNAQKLAATLQSLKAQRPQKFKNAEFKTITFNFKDSSDTEKYSKLISQLKALDIGLFVNNVGTSEVNMFHNYTHQQIVEFININCVSMAALSADVLAIMKNRPHKSALINLSSYMQQKSMPYLSLYSATKAFNMNLTQGLSYQYPQIDVLCLKPMFVETPLSRQKKGFTVPDRRECAADSLKELGWEHQSYGHISHRIIGCLRKNLIPDWLYRIGVRLVTKPFLKRAFPNAKFD